jgi:hypothetical protein
MGVISLERDNIGAVSVNVHNLEEDTLEATNLTIVNQDLNMFCSKAVNVTRASQQVVSLEVNNCRRNETIQLALSNISQK